MEPVDFLELQAAVLGPLQFLAQGTDVTPSAPKLRRLAALFLLHANRVLTLPTIAAELWEDSPPRAARTTIQTYVLWFRRRIADALGLSRTTIARMGLITTEKGYLLRVEPRRLDLYRFDELCTQGRTAFRRNDFETAARMLGRAVDLWRGPALIDVQAGPVLRPRVDALDRSLLTAQDLRIEANLRLGRHHKVLSELATLTVEHPLSEALHEKLMRALLLAGRRREALDVFHRLRANLRRHAGREPSGSVNEVLRTVLGTERTTCQPLDEARYPLATDPGDRTSPSTEGGVPTGAG